VLAAALVAGSFFDVSAQSTAAAPPDSAAFLAVTRAAAARYADRERAIADGYGPIGPDTPAMGAHWVHIGTIADGVFDPARPSFLTYVEAAGRPLLAGVGFALALDDAEKPPPAPTGAAWHFHAGTVAVEVREHASDPPAGERGPRVAVFHAWVGIENPAGTFATENWALPWVRLELGPPLRTNVDASRAAALAAGMVGFYAVSWGAPDAKSQEVVASALARAAAESAAIVMRIARGTRPSAEVLSALSDIGRRARITALSAAEP
jgi:hypothetical protein